MHLLKTLLLSSLLMAASFHILAAPDLTRVPSELSAIDYELKQLRKGDVQGYNALSARLTAVAGVLQQPGANSVDAYASLVNRWRSVQQNMAQLAQTWQAAAPSQPAAATGGATTAAFNADAVLARYQPANWPQLAADPTPQQVKQWAAGIQALRSNQLEADLKHLAQARADGLVSAGDAERVTRWISGNFQDQLSSKVAQVSQLADAELQDALSQAERILAVDGGNSATVQNYAGRYHLANNQAALQRGQAALMRARIFETAFGGGEVPGRQAAAERLALAEARLAELAPIAERAEATAVAKPKPKRPEILSSRVEKYWVGGTLIAELDRKGAIWKDGNELGHITNTGEIWVQSNNRGSVEADGSIWFDGNKVGEMSEDGRVYSYLTNSEVGRIYDDGRVWYLSGGEGVIEGFNSEALRAAVVYFFPYFRG